jgi:hypothetical protein
MAQNLSLVKAAVHRFTVLTLAVILLAASKALFIYALRYLGRLGVK